MSENKKFEDVPPSWETNMNPALMGSGITGAALLFATAFDYFGVEAFLAAKTGLPSNYAPAMLAFGSFLFVNNILGMHVVRARAQHNVPWPALYADPTNPKAAAFNCIQRAHQQTLENVGGFLGALAVAGQRYPVTTGLLGAVWALTRIFFMLDYSKGASQRNRRAGLGTVAFMILGGLSMLTAFHQVGLALPWNK
eukprot:TRINITY_DN3931_c0_g2_i1.p1 TRINITY_DN3931_c0_g2~~TRINITY_DN3931_c0_g2_i1.p1  ORF type:complete len:196 (-),score=29.20 TRINITY_DN3931_c0_g2_i1:3-590(-)